MQIENEYEPESKSFGPAGQAYVQWAAKMAVGLNTGVPWVMCKEYDAPDPVVSKTNWIQSFIRISIMRNLFIFQASFLNHGDR